MNSSNGRPRRNPSEGARRAQHLLGELLLSEVRQLAGKSQQEVAETLGMKQPSLSKLEKQADMQISTLRKIIKALGGELEVLARFPKGTVKIDQFDQRPAGRAPPPIRGAPSQLSSTTS